MPRGASLTAEAVCFYRALEGLRPPAERVLSDPLAEVFLTPAERALLHAPGLLALHRPGSPLSPGRLANLVVARHRYMDDALLAAVASGVTQVVILGAGYDTRAHRFHEALAGTAVFEVDFPATQARKRATLRHTRTLHRDGVRYVPVDLARDELRPPLEAAGFEIGAPTFFVWEGVAMYLDREAVSGTLTTLRQLGGDGSEVVADFWSAPEGGAPWARAVRFGAGLLGIIGEPLGFQLAPADAPALLASAGWTQRERLAGRALAERVGLRRRPIFASVYLLRAVTDPHPEVALGAARPVLRDGS